MSDNGQKLNIAVKAKFLGLIIDQNLTWTG